MLIFDALLVDFRGRCPERVGVGRVSGLLCSGVSGDFEGRKRSLHRTPDHRYSPFTRPTIHPKLTSLHLFNSKRPQRPRETLNRDLKPTPPPTSHQVTNVISKL